MGRALRIALLALGALLAILLAAAAWSRYQLGASLPPLDGRATLPGLSGAVTVTRDALGIPRIAGRSRLDVARATGYLHAQDRFFQMDLSRRRAAGELSTLVGARALPADQAIRVHRFRAEALRALDLMTSENRALLEAYADGVNRGLAALGARPFEYLLLRQPPEPWRAEDSLLVVLSMFVTLQDPEASYESTADTLHAVLPPAMAAFLDPRGTEWDAPVIGEAFATPPIPGPEVYDLRARRAGRAGRATSAPAPAPTSGRSRINADRLGLAPWRAAWARVDGDSLADRLSEPAAAAGDTSIGSNNWAVSGAHTADGAALLASDPHLGIRVPNTWYRAQLAWEDASGAHTLTGVTLPGSAALVQGSNGDVAWGFTNSYGDWGDIVRLDVDPSDPSRYRTPDGWRRFESFDEVFRTPGEPDLHQTVRWTIWGPVLPSGTGPDARGRARAYRWVAHEARQLAGAVLGPESARTIDEAIAAAHGLGTPGQNMLVAGRDGRIGWTLYGAIPRRTGFDGQRPASWADGARGWTGWLDESEYPRIVDPPDGRLWTANARVVDGPMLEQLGDGGYDIGVRAQIIRDRLRARDRFTPADMLAIQLDTSATFLERWRRLVLDTLTPAAVGAAPDRGAFRDLVERSWTGQASLDSVGYRLTRAFRDAVAERVLPFVVSECTEADPTFAYATLRRREGPLWALASQQPRHLLDPAYASWNALLVDAVDGAIARVRQEDTPGQPGGPADLSAHSWGTLNRPAFRHPLSAAVPFLARWLDMPVHALAGDSFTPRVHNGTAGASIRMVVSPGRESEGIAHMPTGQSGHPLSPFYGNSHQAWVEGTATPFLPGPVRHTLVLEP